MGNHAQRRRKKLADELGVTLRTAANVTKARADQARAARPPLQGSFDPEWASPPGHTIFRACNERGLVFTDLARKLGTHGGSLHDGTFRITPEAADIVASTIGPSAAFWLKREAQYREALARQGGAK